MRHENMHDMVLIQLNSNKCEETSKSIPGEPVASKCGVNNEAHVSRNFKAAVFVPTGTDCCKFFPYKTCERFQKGNGERSKSN